jgi:hypothetical protein
MKSLIVSEKAYDDLLSILQYIARDKPQTAVQFVDKIEQQCEFLPNPLPQHLRHPFVSVVPFVVTFLLQIWPMTNDKFAMTNLYSSPWPPYLHG